MLTISMYLLTSVWMICLILSAYGTYRLYEYGPYNANLVWSLVRNVTDWLSCVALGIVTILLLAGIYEFGGIHVLYHICAFCVGFVIAKVILLLILHAIASPYLKKERERNERFDAIQNEEAERITSGLPLERKSFFPNDQDWVKAKITKHKVE